MSDRSNDKHDQTHLTAHLKKPVSPDTEPAPIGEGATLPPAAPPEETETLPPQSVPLTDREVEGETMPPLPTTAFPTSKPVAEVPGYEILRELGRGGMGVVYQARHLQLNRTVALKMILSGAHAGAADLARFRTEAEAVARLQHPGIVQIFEISSHNGLPFFSLEFCAGGALDDKLSGAPMQPMEAAALVEQLARAMQVAHDANVIHRDLKPANVLLTESGEPKITDFGLAKKLDEAGQTQSGSIMGTPSYMAPEQAGGKQDAIGPLADVYALGAVLYDCLTGHPPFKAATAMDTILQVLSQEPVPVTQVQPTVDRDLETICMKCLEKEPQKRYGSAQELAEDLRRFQSHEHILARPVGSLEKLSKWIKRNPVVSALTAAMILVLIAGATVSSVLAVTATKAKGKAEAAQKTAQLEAENARRSERKAMLREKEAIAAKVDLEKKNEQLQISVARSHGRSLLSKLPADGALPPLSEVEREALTDLMSVEQDAIRLHFVREALRASLTVRQLRLRAEQALRASVGLSPQRRSATEQMLESELEKGGVIQAQRADVALIAAKLGDLSPKTARLATAALIQEMKTAQNPVVLRSLVQGLRNVAVHLHPRDAIQAVSEVEKIPALPNPAIQEQLINGKIALAIRMPDKAAVTTLTQTMAKTSSVLQWRSLAIGLSTVAERLPPGEGAACLLKALQMVKEDVAMATMGERLRLVAGRMSHADAAGVCARGAAILAAKLSNPKPGQRLPSLPRVIVHLAARMQPKEAADLLTPLMAAATEYRQFQPLSLGVSYAAARMQPDAALQHCSKAVEILASALEKPNRPYPPQPLVETMNAVLSALPRKEALRKYIDLMITVIEANASSKLRKGLSRLMISANSAEVATALFQLIQRTGSTNDRRTATAQFQSYKILASHLNAKDANRIATKLNEALIGTENNLALQMLSAGFPEVAERLSPKAAAEQLARVIRTLEQLENRQSVDVITYRVIGAAKRIRPEDAPRITALLKKAISRADKTKQQFFESILVAVAARLPARDAARAVAQIHIASQSSLIRARAIQSMSVVAKRIGRGEADDAARMMIKALSDELDDSRKLSIAMGLVTLAEGMEPESAMMVLAQVMAASRFERVLLPGVRKFVLFAEKLPQKHTAQVAAELARLTRHTKAPASLKAMAQSLEPLIPKLSAKVALARGSQVADALLAILPKTNNSIELKALAEGFAATGAAIPAQKASAVLRGVSQKLVTLTDVGAQRALAKQIPALVGRLPSSLATRNLVRAIGQVRDNLVLLSLNQSLAIVAPQLRPKDAALEVKVLEDLIAKTKDTRKSFRLDESLSLIASQMQAKEAVLVLQKRIRETRDLNTLRFMIDGIARTVVALEPAQRAKLSRASLAVLVPKIVNNAPKPMLHALVPSVASLAKHLPASVVTDLCRELVVKLSTARAGAPVTIKRKLCHAIAQIAPQLEPRLAAKILTDFMNDVADTSALKLLFEGWSALAAQMPAREALSMLQRAMQNVRHGSTIPLIAERIAETATRLPAEEANRACSKVTALLAKILPQAASAPHTLATIATGLTSLAPYLQPDDAANALTAILEVMTTTKVRSVSHTLGAVSSAISRQMRPGEGAAYYVKAMFAASDRHVHATLETRMHEELKLVPPAAVEKTAILLIESMIGNNDVLRLRALLTGLAIISKRVPVERALPIVQALTQAISDTQHHNSVQLLSNGFELFLWENPAQHTAAIGALVGTCAQPGLWAAGYAQFSPVSKPVPCRFNPKQLVAMLKLSGCSARPTRIILDQLQTHYGQPFATRWDFVRYAKAQQLQLDFESPPKFALHPSETK